ncbi:MAG TPA: hypothetical protein VE843_09775, partial [Ktedonobacteraceae bacterium]|nr:hypothetical protein [Ktedonobacteraceae bacterium]
MQHSKFVSISILVVFTLALTLISCSGSSSTTTTPSTIAGQRSGNTTTMNASPAPNSGLQPCPDAVKSPAHWDAIIPTQIGVMHVEKVMCGNLTGNTTLQALVTVR